MLRFILGLACLASASVWCGLASAAPPMSSPPPRASITPAYAYPYGNGLGASSYAPRSTTGGYGAGTVYSPGTSSGYYGTPGYGPYRYGYSNGRYPVYGYYGGYGYPGAVRYGSGVSPIVPPRVFGYGPGF